MPNGNAFTKNITKFRFVYAYVHQSINSKINNLGNNESTNKLIVSIDPRWKQYLDTTGSDKVTINGKDYNIIDVSLDDSDVVPIYSITIGTKSSFSGDY